jgi:hypothetical protein
MGAEKKSQVSIRRNVSKRDGRSGHAFRGWSPLLPAGGQADTILQGYALHYRLRLCDIWLAAKSLGMTGGRLLAEVEKETGVNMKCINIG